MSGVNTENEETTVDVTGQFRISLPSRNPISEEERHRRQKLYKQTKELRAEIGTIDIPTYELVREGRDE